MAPKVSILLPVFNAAETLADSLRSIRRQSCLDWECVLVDDGSTDGSVEVARAVALKDSRVNVLPRDHSGLIETLNAGVENCRGEFVARLDADDWMRRDRLESQIGGLEDDPTLDLVGTHVRIFPRDGLGDGSRDYERWLNSMRLPEDISRERFVECPLAHPTWTMRRATLNRLGYRDRGWPEDYDFLLRLLQSGGKAGIVPRRLVGWRHHTRRLSRHDPRYSLQQFTACRAYFLASGFLKDTDGFLLWGYGQTGRALRRELAKHGKQLSGLIEVHPGRIGQEIHGAAVVAPEDIGTLPNHPLIVSVAGAGPRNEIRDKLAQLNRVEGRDFVCAA